MKIQNKINILCATDDKYVPYCGIMLSSLFENNKEARIDVYILTEGINSKNQDELKQLAKKHSKNIIFVIIDDYRLRHCPIRVGDHVSLATYYRLLAPILIPQDIDKILYLDCDIIINGNIEKLYNTDINNKAIGAVIDEAYLLQEKYLRLDYYIIDKYFNAGVLLINLDYWRRNRVMERCFSYIKQHPDRLKFHDQDTLNAVLHNEKSLLPIKYNLQTGFLLTTYKYEQKIEDEIIESVTSPTIIHYTGKSKPWYRFSKHPFKKRYKYYSKKTVWHSSAFIDNTTIIDKIKIYSYNILWALAIKGRPLSYKIRQQE